MKLLTPAVSATISVAILSTFIGDAQASVVNEPSLGLQTGDCRFGAQVLRRMLETSGPDSAVELTTEQRANLFEAFRYSGGKNIYFQPSLDPLLQQNYTRTTYFVSEPIQIPELTFREAMEWMKTNPLRVGGGLYAVVEFDAAQGLKHMPITRAVAEISANLHTSIGQAKTLAPSKVTSELFAPHAVTVLEAYRYFNVLNGEAIQLGQPIYPGHSLSTDRFYTRLTDSYFDWFRENPIDTSRNVDLRVFRDTIYDLTWQRVSRNHAIPSSVDFSTYRMHSRSTYVQQGIDALLQHLDQSPGEVERLRSSLNGEVSVGGLKGSVSRFLKACKIIR